VADTASTRETVRVVAAYVRPHRTSLLAGIALLLLSGGLGLAQPLAAGDVIEALTAKGDVTGPILLLTALVAVAALAMGIGSFLVVRVTEETTLAARRGLVRHILGLTVPGMRSQSPGDLLARVTADTAVLRQVASQLSVQVVTGVVMLVGALALMWTVDVVLLGTAVAVIAVLGLVVLLLMPRIRAAALAAQRSVGTMGAVIERSLGAFTTVKAAGAEQVEQDRVDSAAKAAYDQGIVLAKWGSAAGTAVGLAMQLAFLGVLGVGGARVASGAMTIADMITFLLYVAYLTSPLMQLVQAGTVLQAGRAAVTRIGEVTALPVERPRAVVVGPRGRQAKSPATVIFDGVGFTYPGRDVPALAEVDIAVVPGRLTALVGPSGSGKSTLLSLVERFHDPDVGRVLVDGIDVREWDLRRLRASIAYVEQDAPVLAGSLRENLTYGAPAVSEERIREVVWVTRLASFVNRLGGDLDAPITHRGGSLSGGERQRIAIARALLREPRLLMLDEATSQLDAVNEAAMRELIQDVSSSTTVLAVAHRLSTVAGAARIVVMSDGRVTAIGEHDDLVRNDRLYARLAAEQTLRGAGGP
jgi:ABC-type multidrug transport system fused ATPase/permease subunit